MPLDWNKINEEDSSISGYNSTHEDQQFQMPTPKITKIISDPGLSISKLKRKTSMNDASDLNLQKLQALQTQQVWLFVPKTSKYDHSQDIHQAIKQLKNIKKAIRNSGGWNILVSSKQEAKKMVDFGYKKNKTFLKFYVSTKNYENDSTPQIKRKGSNSSSNYNDEKSFKSPQKQRKVRYEEQDVKKKSKYLEKKTESMVITQKLIEEQEKVTEKEVNPSQQIEIQQNLVQEIQEKQEQKIQGALLNQNEPQNQLKQEKEQNQNVEVDEGYDSEQSLQRMKRALKKKNKKLNKKKGSPNSHYSIDENNPFSLLTK